MATASDRIVAEQVAAHVGLFSDVMASDATHNLRGKKKAEALIARYGNMVDMLEIVITIYQYGSIQVK